MTNIRMTNLYWNSILDINISDISGKQTACCVRPKRPSKNVALFGPAQRQFKLLPTLELQRISLTSGQMNQQTEVSTVYSTQRALLSICKASCRSLSRPLTSTCSSITFSELRLRPFSDNRVVRQAMSSCPYTQNVETRAKQREKSKIHG